MLPKDPAVGQTFRRCHGHKVFFERRNNVGTQEAGKGCDEPERQAEDRHDHGLDVLDRTLGPGDVTNWI